MYDSTSIKLNNFKLRFRQTKENNTFYKHHK